MSENILEINNLKKYFPIKKGMGSKIPMFVKAVDGIGRAHV